MTIQVTPEQEVLISHAIQAGVIRAADEALNVGVETIRHRLEQAAQKPMNAEEWKAKFHAWVHGHDTPTPLLSDQDISRDSIHGNRSM